ncbi:hypothetical protein QOZ80_8BG0662870 [Eleusine coracana subsp. coracana]|nr:hypothetical protein QOZ80_8BG0662870 [Eleusine coracana subsp. coracana]
METVQERDLHQRQAWWPLDTMACSLESSSSLFGWDPQLFYLGQGADGNGAGDSGAHECHELDLLVPKYDNHFDLGTIPATAPTSTEKTLTPQQAELPSSSSSQGIGDPRTSDTTSGTQHRTVGANSLSTKRSAPKEKESKGDESCKKRRPASSSTVGAGSSVLRPFAVVKPSGTDGEVTLADINEWILTPPAHPVRHPVGEFACGRRVSVDNRPAPSGKTVSGFTRLHTVGRGTITVVRTRG